MKRLLTGALLVLALGALSCGGDDDPVNPNGNGGGGGGGGGGKSFSAKIDGASWTANSASISITGGADPRLGTILITGGDSSGRGLGLNLSFISDTPSPYPLGVNPGSNAGGTVTLSATTPVIGSWTTPLNGDAGTVTITLRTATRIKGTFECTAEPFSGGAASDVEITDGEFDITIPGGLPALPTGIGNTMAATVGGESWNAATIVQVGGGASFGGMNTKYSVNFVGLVSPGMHNLGTGVGKWGATIIETGTANAWSAPGDSVGTIFFVLTPNRMVGLFNGTFPKQGGGPDLEIENGSFGVYLP